MEGMDLGSIVRRAEQLGWLTDGDPLSLILREGFGPLGADDPGVKKVDFAEIQSALRPYGGELQIANVPSGGMRASRTPAGDGAGGRHGGPGWRDHLCRPISSIQRIVHSAGADLMRISAAEGRYMLKLAPEEVLPVKFLERCGDASRDEDSTDTAVSGRPTQRRRRNRRGSEKPDEQKHLFVVAGA